MLQLEDVLVEFLLKLLVGVVDTELLKAVLGEVFKSVNIKNANEALHLCDDFGRSKEAVHRFHEPVKEGRVNVLGHRVPDHESLGLVEVGHDLLSTSYKLLLDSPLREFACIYAKELTGLDE